jgi:hypothetical protein
MSLIALEEHYAWDPASADNVVATWLRSNNDTAYRRRYDRGPLRLEQMDAAGIDFQILSLFDPGVQEMDDVTSAVDLAGLRLHAGGDGRRSGDVPGRLPDGRQPGRGGLPGVVSDG